MTVNAGTISGAPLDHMHVAVTTSSGFERDGTMR